jgi:mediator of RNA polymerase II transcription subunit 12
MRVEFKRLAMRIENNNEPAEASLDREISADDADLLCETFRGIEPVVMQEVRSGNEARLC